MATRPPPWPQKGDGIGYAGYKHQQGELVIAMTDNHGSVLAPPLPVAPVHETDMVLVPQGLHTLKQGATPVGLDLKGAYVHLDGGCDAVHHRKCMCNAGMIPTIPEHPRNRKHTKGGRKRWCNA
jgi:hypothetical protein